jgi:hypothetical protein
MIDGEGTLIAAVACAAMGRPAFDMMRDMKKSCGGEMKKELGRAGGFYMRRDGDASWSGDLRTASWDV